MNISIIIPSYNGKKLLEKNLPATLAATRKYPPRDIDILIVDDGSNDGTGDFIRNFYPDIKYFSKEKNTGFINTVNLGVEKANGEIVILLNNDVSPEENFIESLLIHFTNPLVFAVGCLEKSLINQKEVLSGKSIGYFTKGLIWHDRAKNQLSFGSTFWVAGGSGAFSKKIWQELNGLDKIYSPFYWEDIDLCYRAQKCGYKVLYEPQSQVFHQHETTIGSFYSASKIKTISVRNQFLFFWKNINDRQLLIFHVLFLPINFLINLLRLDSNFIFGLFQALKFIPVILKKRNALYHSYKLSDTEILNKFGNEK